MNKIIEIFDILVSAIFKVRFFGKHVEKVVDLKERKDSFFIYIMPKNSWVEKSLLRSICKQKNLPRPVLFRLSDLKFDRSEQTMALGVKKIFWTRQARSPEFPLQINQLIREQSLRKDDPSFDIRIVPVSVFWTRNAVDGTAGFLNSLRFLLSDDDHAGYLNRILTLTLNCRRGWIHFGESLSLREQIAIGDSEGTPHAEISRKITRVLRVHFQNLRRLTLGPNLGTRFDVIHDVLSQPELVKVLKEESIRSHQSIEKIRHNAEVTLASLVADRNLFVVWCFEKFLDFFWSKVYKGIVVVGLDNLLQKSEGQRLVYVASHRSHLDYLLFPSKIFKAGLNIPYIAAGDNLNFWPAGPLLRRAGAFFIKRKIKGNRIYAALFSGYVRFLIRKGHPIAFFPEGGRSRSGRLLIPKTGMLSMICDSYLKDPVYPVAFVPVYISYDKVAEIKSYFKEIRGKAKRKEDVGQLIKATRIFKGDYGKAYIRFGDPIKIDEHFKAVSLDMETDFVGNLARFLMQKMNNLALVTPVSLVATAVLSNEQRVITKADLTAILETYLGLLEVVYAEGTIQVIEKSPSRILEDALQYLPFRGFSFPDEVHRDEILYYDETEGFSFAYYQNNIMHLFVLPSLISCIFLEKRRASLEEIHGFVAVFYSFLKNEYFLSWTDEEAKVKTTAILDELVKRKILFHREGIYEKPAITDPGAAILKSLAQIKAPYLFGLATLGLFHLQTRDTHLKTGAEDTHSEANIKDKTRSVIKSRVFRLETLQLFDDLLMNRFLRFIATKSSDELKHLRMLLPEEVRVHIEGNDHG